MKNSEALVILSDAIDLQRETVALLRETMEALKTAVDEMKASRCAPFTYTPLTSPTYIPYVQPQQTWTSPFTFKGVMGEGITNGTISNQSTCEAQNMGVFCSNSGDICGQKYLDMHRNT